MEDKRELKRLIKEDNVEEFERILNAKKTLQNNFNTNSAFHNLSDYFEQPLLLFAVQEKSQKVVEYLLSQDFVDKSICNGGGENIYHAVCGIRGAEELFSMIERKVPHNLILYKSRFADNGKNAFHIACEKNNIFIVKRVYEIMESLQVDLTHIKKYAIQFAIKNKDIEVIKYILSIDGIQLNVEELFSVIKYSKTDIVVYLLNVYLYRSIPSHLHNQFHIFHFLNNHPSNNNNNNNNINNIKRIEENNAIKLQKRNRDELGDDIFINHIKKIKLFHINENNEDSNYNIVNNEDGNNDYEYYLKLVEDNYNKIMNIKLRGNRIWHCVCINVNLDVVQLICSLKGIQPCILNDDGFNAFLRACSYNSNIKIIKYLHKLFPSLIHSQKEMFGGIQNAAFLLLDNSLLEKSDKLKTLHYLYLNGIDIHFLSKIQNANENGIIYQSLYSYFRVNNKKGAEDDIDKYLKVISQDFDYLKNEHDDEAYRKPSFWNQFQNNKLGLDEESNRINEWKNRYEEHVLRHLSKMIQEHMLQPKSKFKR